jgi:hypothetical protein
MSRAVGLSLQLKDERSGKALTLVSQFGSSGLYHETARVSSAADPQSSAEVKRDGGSWIVLELYRIAVRSAPRSRRSSCWRTY